ARQPQHGASAEALELGLDGQAHGGGSAGDIDLGRVEPDELGADDGGEDAVLWHKKEGTVLCGGNRPGGKGVGKVSARCDHGSELFSRGLRQEAVRRDGDGSAVTVSASEACGG